MHLLQQDALVSCPGCLYAIRFQAMEAKLTDLIQKGRWQRLYLKHCFSPETQYLFMILYELLGIDREADVKDLIKTSLLPETGPLAQMTPTPGSKRYYLSYCEDWFLRRYNKKEAKWCLQKRLKLVPANRLDRWLDGIKLSFPRIIASIIIGYLPLIFTTETWYVSIAEAWGVNFLLPILTLSASMFYLFTEVKNNLEYTTEVYRDRARSIFWFSLRVSLYLGMLLLPLIGVYLPAEAKIDELSGGYPYLWIFFSYANFCLFLKMLLFHVPLALFIGIIVQVIWEEKPVSYPL
uniref:hypothetical protein n=1 Tax=Desulfobacca sp. TaxID=2067990 RepID=UPI00404BA287